LDLAALANVGGVESMPFESTPGVADVIGLGHPQRKKVETFIARRFREVHGAHIAVFMPQLLALFDDQGAVRAAAGIRDAGIERLFLEYYLDTSVEQAIADKEIADKAGAASTVAVREQIVEIGNLASIDRCASRALFKLLARRLSTEDFQWAVFTGCSSLHRMFAILGLETVGLGRALQSRLPVDQQTWGGYYEDNPQVVAGRVGPGLRVFDGLIAG
jgi:hypothetical protein